MRAPGKVTERISLVECSTLILVMSMLVSISMVNAQDVVATIQPQTTLFTMVSGATIVDRVRAPC